MQKQKQRSKGNNIMTTDRQKHRRMLLNETGSEEVSRKDSWYRQYKDSC